MLSSILPSARLIPLGTVARIFVAYHSFAELPLGPKTEAGRQHCPPARIPLIPAAECGSKAFSSNVSDVISCMPYFVIPWLAIDLVDWHTFPSAGTVTKALTCTDSSWFGGFAGSGAVN